MRANLKPVAARFAADRRGTSAVEFAIVSMPLILIVLMTLQMGIYYMAQSSLDAGVIQTADTLVNRFYSGSAPTIPTSTQLKTMVVAQSGGLIRNDANLFVELRLLSSLATGAAKIGNTVESSSSGSILALRAQASIPVFVPGLRSLATVRSTVLLRRQNS